MFRQQQDDMDVTSLCIRLLISVLFLMCDLDQRVDSVVLRVSPNRLQFFEYESPVFHCEGFSASTGWKLVYNIKGNVSSCKTTGKVTSTGFSCTINNIYPDDSGEYFCKADGGERSISINIDVTAGPVLLESPALPVMERETVTLSCRNKMVFTNLTADFYKDGRLKMSSSTGNVTIHNVSRSDEGLYKCRISDVGESAESRLAVRDEVKTTSSTHPPNTSPSSSSTPWIIVTVVLAALLLAVGLLHLRKGYWHRVSPSESTLIPGPSSPVDQTDASTAAAGKPTYAVVKKNRKKKGGGELLSGGVYYILGLDDTDQLEPRESGVTENSALSAVTHPTLTDAFYSTIQ